MNAHPQAVGPKRVVVIGGGVGGLATAVLLAHRGARVTLLEQRNQLGGRAGLHEEAGFRFDTGPSWYLMPEVFERFFASVGENLSEHLDLVTLDPGYRVFSHGLLEPGSAGPAAGRPDVGPGAPGAGHLCLPRSVDVPHGRARVRALFESLEPGAGLRFDRYVDSAIRTYDLATQHFLYTVFDAGFASRLPRTLADPMVRAQAAGLPRLLFESLATRTKRAFRHPLLRQILDYPAVFLGTDPRRAPSLYHLMSRLDLVDGVRYPLGGMYELIRTLARLAKARGVDIVTGAHVTTVQTSPHRRRGGRSLSPRARISGVVARTAQGVELWEADAVVGACDLNHLDTLMGPDLATRTSARWRKQDPGIGAFTLLLGVRGRLPELAHHNLFFTRDWVRNFDDILVEGRLAEPASAYVCVPSRTDPSVAPKGCENLFVLVPAPANAQLRSGQRAVKDYAERIVASLGAAIGRPELRGELVVRRVAAPGDFTAAFHAWRGTALGPANVLGQSAMFRSPVRSPRVSNLVFAGAYAPPGVGLPMCLISAENAVAALSADLGAAQVRSGGLGAAQARSGGLGAAQARSGGQSA